MNKVFEQIRRYWLTNLITFFVALVLGGVIFCLFFFTRNRDIIDALNGATYAGLILAACGLFAWLAHLGTFDIFAFGFKQLGSMIFSKNPRSAGTFPEYVEGKKEKRNNSSYNFIFIILAALLFGIAALILTPIYKNLVLN